MQRGHGGIKYVTMTDRAPVTKWSYSKFVLLGKSKPQPEVVEKSEASEEVSEVSIGVESAAAKDVVYENADDLLR